MKKDIFIDGETGTTGLQVHEKLSKHPNVNVMSVDQSKRKDIYYKKEMLAKSDVTFLCLPDETSIETSALVDHSLSSINRIQTSPISFSDSFGNPLESLISQTQMQIVGTIENQLNYDQEFIYFFQIKNSIFGFSIDLSPALIGVGYIIGLNISILVFTGGIISWLIAIPIYSAFNPSSGDITNYAWMIWDSKIRFLGVGAMLTGGFWSIIKIIKPIINGISNSILDVEDFASYT